MKERVESLLVVRSEGRLRGDSREMMLASLSPIAAQMGMRVLILDGGLDAGIHSDIRPLIEEQLVEQRKTNQLLMMLIAALGEEETDPDAEPKTYMDGSPV